MFGIILFLVFAGGVAMIALAKTKHLAPIRVEGLHARVIGGFLCAPFVIRLVVTWYVGLTTWDMSDNTTNRAALIASILAILLSGVGIWQYHKRFMRKPEGGEAEVKEEVEYVVPETSSFISIDGGETGEQHAA